MARIDHAAIRTKSYEEAQHFFEDVFEMHMWREIGEKPGRKCWYKEGIQLCEVEELDADIHAKVLEGTNMLVLSVTADTPKESIDIIRTVMDNYSSVSLYTVGSAVMDVLEEPIIRWMQADRPRRADLWQEHWCSSSSECSLI